MDQARRRYIPRLSPSPKANLSGNHFLDDYGDKSQFDWSFSTFRDFTREYCYKAGRGLPSRDGKWMSKFKSKKVYIVIVAVLILIVCGYFGYKWFTSIKNPHDQVRFIQTNLVKLEDEVERMKKQVKGLSDDLKPQIPKLIDGVIESTKFNERLESYANERTNNIVNKELDERLKPFIEREIREMIENLIKNELMYKMIEQVHKSVDEILEHKMKESVGLDSNILKKSIRTEIKRLFDDRNKMTESKPDYASELNSAKVIDASLTYTEPDAFKIFSIPLWSLSSSPNQLLKRSDNLLMDKFLKPWKMDTQQGFIRIKLAKPIIPQSFTYEHVLRNSVLDENQYQCSPKVFRVFGYENEQFDEQQINLGEFSFEIKNGTEAEFMFHNVSNPISVIQFNIENNHGNSNYTCLYRIKVF